MGHGDLHTTSAPVQVSPHGRTYSSIRNELLTVELTDDRCKCCVEHMRPLKIASRRKGSHVQSSGWPAIKCSPHEYWVETTLLHHITCVHTDSFNEFWETGLSVWSKWCIETLLKKLNHKKLKEKGEKTEYVLQDEIWRKKQVSTPVFLPGKSHGQRGLGSVQGVTKVGHDWAHTQRMRSDSFNFL